MPFAAVCQMNSGPDRKKNLEQARELVMHATALGASFVSLPENFELMSSAAEKLSQAESLEGPTLTSMSELAKALGITLHCGSFAERTADPAKIYNTSVVVGPNGATLGVYRKIHLFDVELNDGATYRESENVLPGREVVTAETSIGRLGLSVCYDLRFPELYRHLASAGAAAITVPAAFTLMTGKDHWEVLLRARAIENQCYVIAAGQHGSHPGNRLTYGHSMIVDPWGTVLCCCPDGPGVALAEIDPTTIARVRSSLPALKHRRLDL